MKKYRIELDVVMGVSMYDVEADSLESAKEIAKERLHGDLYYHVSRGRFVNAESVDGFEEEDTVTGESIAINGEVYEVVLFEFADGIFDIVSKLKPLQAHPYYEKYVYRCKDGSIRACYKNDLLNNWSI